MTFDRLSNVDKRLEGLTSILILVGLCGSFAVCGLSLFALPLVLVGSMSSVFVDFLFLSTAFFFTVVAMASITMLFHRAWLKIAIEQYR